MIEFIIIGSLVSLASYIIGCFVGTYNERKLWKYRLEEELKRREKYESFQNESEKSDNL